MDNGLDLGGDFSENNCTNCILIYTKEQLIAFRDRVNGGDTCEGKTIKLMSDIDLNGSENDQWIPMTTFAGTFDGNYHSIKNLYMKSDQYANLSLFSNLAETAEVKNLKLENCYIENNYSQLIYNEELGKYVCESHTSAICYYNSGTISNVEISGNIKGYMPVLENIPINTRIVRTHASGICSGSNFGYIQNSANKANIEGESLTENKEGMNGLMGTYVSGICNGNMNIIANCYNTGNLIAKGYNTELIGGISAVSGNTAYVSQEINCYSIGNMESSIVVGNKKDGAIVASSVAGKNTIINSHYLNTLNSTVSLSGTTAQTESTMKTSTFAQILGQTYYTTDETNINNGYPILNWQLK